MSALQSAGLDVGTGTLEDRLALKVGSKPPLIG